MKCVVARVQYDGKILYVHFVLVFCFLKENIFNDFIYFPFFICTDVTSYSMILTYLTFYKTVMRL